jgi:hypothetical protein
MIQDAVAGYNSTLFAYGATGSGKSYSMIGSEKEDGIMQRAIEDVFDLVEQVYLLLPPINPLIDPNSSDRLSLPSHSGSRSRIRRQSILS